MSEPVDRVELTHASGSRAVVFRYGGHVTSWVDAMRRERLYLSRRATFEGPGSIRGGIPVIFPQFADTGPLPMHGFLRGRSWKVVDEGESWARLETSDDEGTRAVWPHAFRAEIEVLLNEDSLRVALKIENLGETEFSFTAALHTYFAVGDIGRARVIGLGGREYVDKTRGYARARDQANELAVTEFTDRVYEGATKGSARLVLREEGQREGRDQLMIETRGFGDWVVWNPWSSNIGRFEDMEPEDYRRMLCVEAARIAKPVTLAGGGSWVGTQRVTSLYKEA